MRFAVRSAPPFHYPADSSDNSKGGIWSGSQPQAEFERTASGRNSDAEHGNRAEGNRAYDARDRRNRDSREKRDMTDRRGNNNRGRHER